jgi:hypothetical protein
MDEPLRSRSEERASYRWPLWFRTLDAQEIHSGLMVDISSGGLAFLCAGDSCSLQVGEPLSLRFNIPRYGDPDEPGDTVCVARTGRVCSKEPIADLRRIGVQFDAPLSLAPADELKLIRSAAEAQVSATCGKSAEIPSASGKGR